MCTCIIHVIEGRKEGIIYRYTFNTRKVHPFTDGAKFAAGRGSPAAALHSDTPFAGHILLAELARRACMVLKNEAHVQYISGLTAFGLPLTPTALYCVEAWHSCYPPSRLRLGALGLFRLVGSESDSKLLIEWASGHGTNCKNPHELMGKENGDRRKSRERATRFTVICPLASGQSG